MTVHPDDLRDKSLKNVPIEVPDNMLNNEWSHRNHSQSLDRLSQRGGMGVLEILDNIHQRTLSARKCLQSDVDELNKLLTTTLIEMPAKNKKNDFDRLKSMVEKDLEIKCTTNITEVKMCKQGGKITFGVDSETYHQISKSLGLGTNEYVAICYIVNKKQFDLQ